MIFDLEPFSNALFQLETGITEYNLRPDEGLVRDALIQRFEYTYEISHKTLRRFLAATEPSPAEIKEMTFVAMIRRASERGLMLNGFDKWSGYREARSITSHTYNGKKAQEVLDIVPEFAIDARYLHDRLAERIANENAS